MQRKVVLKEALKYVSDKEKVLDWLGLDPPKGSPSLSKQELSIANVIKIQTLIDQQRKTLADVDYLDLDYVAKVIKIHANPEITDKKVMEILQVAPNQTLTLRVSLSERRGL